MESVIGRQQPAGRGRFGRVRSLKFSGREHSGVAVRLPDSRGRGILSRIESNGYGSQNGSGRPSWLLRTVWSRWNTGGIKAFFRPAGGKRTVSVSTNSGLKIPDFSSGAFRNSSQHLLGIDFSPHEQGFLAGMLLFFFVSLFVLTTPQVESIFNSSPFNAPISLEEISAPQALQDSGGAVSGRGDGRHVSADAEDLDISRFQSLSFDTHVVQSGDTLSGIAQRYGITLDTLVSFNQISDSRTVQIGTEFDIPSRSGLRHIVERGESVSSVAGQYSVSVEEILDVNDLDSTTLSVGDELFIPGARMRSTELRLILGELFVKPTAGRMTSGFGTRTDPFTGRRSFHNGVDWANAPGTPVVAAMAGRVVEVGNNRVYGRYVIIDHPEGFQSMYAHLGSTSVREGQRVSQRQRIGGMGNTGRSTGSHLHFSLFENGRPVDPLRHVH